MTVPTVTVHGPVTFPVQRAADTVSITIRCVGPRNTVLRDSDGGMIGETSVFTDAAGDFRVQVATNADIDQASGVTGTFWEFEFLHQNEKWHAQFGAGDAGASVVIGDGVYTVAVGGPPPSWHVGSVASVNGYPGPNVVLDAGDVGAIPVSEKGAANGVAELDATGLVPSTQLPPSSGGGVVSVNGDTGPAVVLGAGDVGADPAGSATSAQSNAENYTDIGFGNLGDAATLDVGTVAGTVAAGDVAQAAQDAADTAVDAMGPDAPGAILRHQQPGMAHWFAALEAAKSAGVAKIQVYDDSTGEINGTDSWPWQMHGILASYNKVQPAEILGTRYLGASPQTTTTAGTASALGAGAHSSVIAAGDELTQTFYGDGITVIYGTLSTGGTINVYDGPSSGTVVATVSTSDPTSSYSHLLDVPLPLGQHTVTVQVSGGTGTLIEQLVPHCGTLTQGVDVRETTRLGANTFFFGDDTAVYASHGLDLTENWQPDLVISKLGQNDNTDAQYAARTEHLVDAIHARAPNSSVLIVVGYATLSNATDGPVRIAAAKALLPGREDWLSVTSVYSQMGVIATNGPASLTRFDYNLGNSVHPSATGALLMAQEIAGIVSGDPIGMAVRAPFQVAENTNVRWVGDVTGNVTGKLTPVTAEITASGVLNVNQTGYTLVYNGTSDIIVTVDGFAIAQAFGIPPPPTRFIQNGTGTITIGSGSGMTAVGDLSTDGPGTALIVIYAVEMGTNVLAVREGGAVAGDDPRLSDARTPTVHAGTHAAGGIDPVTPAAIGAVAVGGAATTLWSGTQTAYDAIVTPDPGTVYVVTP